MRVRDEELDGQPVRWREADGGDPPVLYVHGVPTAGWDFEPFLERTGGIAPDLPGFGASGKRADLEFTPEFYGRWIERFCQWRGLERVRLVVHDWGVVGLIWAMANPERVERLVVINAVPLLPGYRWHPWARAWRTRWVGEVAMGATNRIAVQRSIGLGRHFAERVMEGWDLGTQRAILRLYRAADPDVLAALGTSLDEIDCPALVVWGEDDPYIGKSFASAYAEALGGEARVQLVPGAGHWPWHSEPSVVEAVGAFLDGP